MTAAPTQPEPAEGPRKDGDPQETKGGGSTEGGQGRSATEPAEGRDDAPPGGAGSPDRGG